MDEMKVWRCGKGHVMGQVARNGDGVRRLLMYRQAVDLNQENVRMPDVMAVVEGSVLDIRCSICGDIRTWIPGEEQLKLLVERVIEGRIPLR